MNRIRDSPAAIALDLRNTAVGRVPGDERSDLLKLPFFPFRVVWCAATALTATLFAVQIVRPKLPSEDAVREP